MKKTLLLSAALCALTAVAQSPIYLYKDGKVIYSNTILPDSIVFHEPVDNGNNEDPNEQDSNTELFLSSEQYMNCIRNTIVNPAPSNVTGNTNSDGTMQSISYYSNIARKMKNADVLLPKNYDPNKKYPVMYVNHGIFGTEKSMQDESNKIRTMANNLAASGEAKEMIIVYTFMYTSSNSDNCSGFNQAECKKYDDFREDLIDCLMPYINQNFSTYTDREHTAISGFSMGGREALYIGITRPQYFGYIGCACPAPGVTPATDNFMSHIGNMQESELKFKDGEPTPYVFLITGGTNDLTVGTFPKQYHETLQRNNVDHLWQEIQGGGHDASCIVPMYYNFIKNIFKNASDLMSGGR
ncbi:MAG: hypothetical protein MJZ33_07260 [Paludibacteraceae bacterium]|nr:hypothetical protein [Paludibacteraceae bacterium]